MKLRYGIAIVFALFGLGVALTNLIDYLTIGFERAASTLH